MDSYNKNLTLAKYQKTQELEVYLTSDKIMDSLIDTYHELYKPNTSAISVDLEERKEAFIYELNGISLAWQSLCAKDQNIGNHKDAINHENIYSRFNEAIDSSFTNLSRVSMYV